MADKKRSSVSRRRWFVLVSGYMAQMMLNGVLFSFGRLIIDVMDTFNATRAEASLIQSLMVGVGRGGGVFWGLAVSHLGPRNAGLIASSVATLGLLVAYFARSLIHIIVSVGILAATGAIIITFSTSVAVGRHFAGNSNAMALSVLATASGTGAIMHSYFLGYLSDTYGLRGTFMILAGLSLHGTAFAWLWGSPSDRKQAHTNDTSTSDELSEIDNSPNSGGSKCELNNAARGSVVSIVSNIIQNEKEINSSAKVSNILSETNKGVVTKTIAIPESFLMFAEGYSGVDIKENNNVPETMFKRLKTILRNRRFIIFGLGNVLGMCCMQSLTIFLMDIVVNKGLSESDATLVFVSYNICSVMGRSSPGLIMKIPRVTTLSVPLIACLLAMVVLGSLDFVQSFPLVMILCCVGGVSQGMMISVSTVVTAKLVGMECLPEAMGFLFTLQGLTAMFAGPISGYLRDITGSYTVSLLVGAAAASVAFMTTLAGQCYKKPSTVTAERRMSVFYVTQI